MSKRPEFPDVMQQVEEVRMWQTTDGKKFHDHDAACDYQERINFMRWCRDNICRGGEWSAQMVAEEVLQYWKVEPRGE